MLHIFFKCSRTLLIGGSDTLHRVLGTACNKSIPSKKDSAQTQSL